MTDLLHDSTQVLIAIITGLVTGIGMLIRRVLTNDKEIGLLKADLERREETRKQRDDKIDKQLDEIRGDIKDLLQKIP